MKNLSLVLACFALLFAGCETLPKISPKSVSEAKNVLIVCDIPQELTGQKIGITVFNNDAWREENPGFDLGAMVADAVKKNVTREVKLLSGKEAGIDSTMSAGPGAVQKATKDMLVGEAVREDRIGFKNPELLKAKLASLSREWSADTVLYISTGSARDFIQNSGFEIRGIGHFYSHREGVYCILGVAAYDAKTGVLSGNLYAHQHVKVPGLDWHFNWNAYPENEQRVFLRALKVVINDCAAGLLVGVGLNDHYKPELAAANGSVFLPPPQKTMVPSGNELTIPDWISDAQAREAVRGAFTNRGWTIVTDNETSIAATYRKKTREAHCTASFQGRKILLIPEGFKVKEDGTKEKVEFYERWHNNLKESIVDYFMKAQGSDSADASKTVEAPK